ncbi:MULTISPECIES: metal-dependent hydrolase [Pseudanabaena]|jgi:inner membrane protein|uniref:metal-dependent hydrolase n=1 Tax=Pseudanabaena TaxID=1152 RepID=UPI00247A9B49|nr:MULTISPECIES: metal-dependent hydrolase [Pseudanabaena]MEA5487487.1 metal-dependent hydrolase [Pseudanabaena sp. CCNP1317]WGS74036.1 metal-dependent hydrolase [Pseudanabaena galeata CCNP1313]
MLSVTHAAIATCATSLIIGTADPAVLAASAIASQLPDVDTTKSHIGLVLYPIARWFEERYPHRGVTHSFMASAIVTAVTAPIALWFSWQIWLGIAIGYFFGWFSDVFTKSGVAAFYPSNARLVIPGNPKARLSTGSSGEYWVLSIAIALLVISCQFISNGGITELFERSFFRSPQTAADIFKKEGATRQVFVKVTGVNIYTSEKIDGQEYKVIAANEASVIGKDANGDLYQIGNNEASQIRATSVETRLGDRIEIQANEVSPKDQFVSEWLVSVPENAYLTGSLLVDNVEDLRLPLEQIKFNVFRITVGQIQILNARKQNLEPILDSFIIDGRVILKVRSDEQSIRQSTRTIRGGDRPTIDIEWCRASDQIFGIGNFG